MAPKPNSAEALASRFSASFSAFLMREEGRRPNQPLELEITNIAMTACAIRRLGADVNELLILGARQMAGQSIDGTIRSIMEGIGEHRESPIEVMLCLGNRHRS